MHLNQSFNDEILTMIYSMTAFASHQSQFTLGSLTVELKSVNNRYLDIHFRIPDELRSCESALRELLSQQLRRGKLEVRISYQKKSDQSKIKLRKTVLKNIDKQLKQAQEVLQHITPPTLTELLSLSQSLGGNKNDLQDNAWSEQCVQTTQLALNEFIAARAREGQRLSQTMLDYVVQIKIHLQSVKEKLPSIQADYQEKLQRKLRETLEKVAPNGFEQISGEELSARIANEAALFSLRIDVTEELDRLTSHQHELALLLKSEKPNKQSVGKRLDFLFQEMNREINTLGSKSNDLTISQTVIELKLLVEQLREQAQNIE